MSVAVARGSAPSNRKPLLVALPSEHGSERELVRQGRRASDLDLETSALDSTRLSARALNAIELLWGREAKKCHLLKEDAYQRLCQTRGIGKQSIAEIERAVVAWGFEGIGGRRAWDESGRRLVTHRKRLEAVLRDVGPKGMLTLLAELCEQRSASSHQKVSTRSSRLRRARCMRAVVYYARSSAYFRRCLASVPALPDL